MSLLRNLHAGLTFNSWAREYDDIAVQSRWIAPQRLAKSVAKFFPPDAALKILDVGTGTGISAVNLSKAFRNAAFYGVDGSSQMLRMARKKLHYIKTDLINLEAEPLPYGDEEFDLVACCGVMEFIREKNFLVSEMARVVKNNGIIASTFLLKDKIYAETEKQLEARGSENIYPQTAIKQKHIKSLYASAKNLHIERQESFIAYSHKCGEERNYRLVVAEKTL